MLLSFWKILWALVTAFLLGAGLMELLWYLRGRFFGSTHSGAVDSTALQNCQAEIATLQSHFKSNLQNKDAEIAALQARFEATVKHKDRDIAQLRAQVDDADKTRQKLLSAEASLTAKDHELSQLQAKVTDLDKTKQQLAESNKYAHDLEIRLKNASHSAQQALSLQANLKAKDDEIIRLKAQQAAETDRADKAKQQNISDESTIQSRDAEIARLKAELEAAQAFARSKSKLSKEEHDRIMQEAEAEAEAMRRRILNNEIEANDLKEITGVGPIMEQTLNDFGVFTFEGVANMSEAQRYRLSESLTAFKGRVERDDWVGQARALYKKNYTAEMLNS